MRNNVVIKQLSVYVAASDQSYMPQLIVVAVGKNAHSLHEIKEVRVHRYGPLPAFNPLRPFYSDNWITDPLMEFLAFYNKKKVYADQQKLNMASQLGDISPFIFI